MLWQHLRLLQAAAEAAAEAAEAAAAAEEAAVAATSCTPIWSTSFGIQTAFPSMSRMKGTTVRRCVSSP